MGRRTDHEIHGDRESRWQDCHHYERRVDRDCRGPDKRHVVHIYRDRHQRRRNGRAITPVQLGDSGRVAGSAYECGRSGRRRSGSRDLASASVQWREPDYPVPGYVQSRCQNRTGFVGRAFHSGVWPQHRDQLHVRRNGVQRRRNELVLDGVEFDSAGQRLTDGDGVKHGFRGEGSAGVHQLATFTDVEIDQAHTATIDWGDGSTSTGIVIESAGSGAVSGSHVYPDDDAHTVTVTVMDGVGGVDSDSLTVTVNNAPPTVNIASLQTLSPGLIGLAPASYNDLGAFDTHTAIID